jgi:serpin B
MTAVATKKTKKNQDQSVSGLKFAAKLQPNLDESTENLFFSPFSILTALGMCAVGARGETQKALANFLEVPEDFEEQKAYFKSLVAEGTAPAGSPYELTTANALWSQKGLKFAQEFATVVKQDYDASFSELDYDEPEKAASVINAWCDKNTNGKIKTIIDKDFINPDTRLILTNAIYFLGKWATQFQKNQTYKEAFLNGRGKEVQVPTMHINSKFRYGETEKFQALELPYEGDDLSMLVLLPTNKAPYKPYGQETPIDADLESAYKDAVESLGYPETVDVSLPKFEMETKYKLGKTFEALGAGIAFSDSANFTGITSNKEALKISEVIHKAFVKCDEEGTEAAAVTAVGVMRCTAMAPRMPKIFKADHPFVFFIRNKNSGSILFSGRVVNP